jgi:hypothetical protein
MKLFSSRLKPDRMLVIMVLITLQVVVVGLFSKTLLVTGLTKLFSLIGLIKNLRDLRIVAVIVCSNHGARLNLHAHRDTILIVTLLSYLSRNHRLHGVKRARMTLVQR